MTTSIAIDGELTVFTAHEIKTRLLQAMASKSTLRVNLGEVTEFDGAGLQLLLAAKHEATQRTSQLVLTSLPTQIQSVLQLTGLLGHFDISPSDTQEVTP